MIKKRLVGLLSHAKKYIGFQVFWQWLALIAQMTAVFSIAELLERVLYGLSDAAIMQRTVLVLLVCIAVRFVCERQAAAASYKASVDVKKILRQKIYDKMLRLGPAYREQVSTSEVMQVSTEGVEQLETYFGRYLPQLLQFIGSGDAVCGALPGEHEGERRSSDLRAADPAFDRGSAEDRKKAS